MGSEGIKVIDGDVSIKNEIKRKRQKLKASEQLEDFANNTTLHGLRYVTDRRLSVVEKIFWLLTFLMSAALCSYLIHNVWTKWRTSPVLVTINEQLVPVQTVPFPSVTICPQMKTKSSVYNYTAEMKLYESMFYSHFRNATIGSTPSEEKFEDIALLCRDSDHYLNPSRDHCNSSVIKHIFEVSPTLDDVFFWCGWRSMNTACKRLFHYVLTQEGVCFTMNTLPAEEHLYLNNLHGDYKYLSSSIDRIEGWSISRGYEKHVKDPYPSRGRPNGGGPDLKVILHEEFGEKDNYCNAPNTGYKVYMQHPAEYPQSSLYYYAVTPGQVASAAVSFSILSTADNLQHYPPEVHAGFQTMFLHHRYEQSVKPTARLNFRQCYFPTERHLRYFRIYSASNCRLECITNYTLEHCGCVGFHMPYDNSSIICTQGMSYCVTDAQEILAEENFDTGLNSIACNCLPACESIDYDADIFITELKAKDFERTWEISLNSTYSQLEVYFKKPRFVSMRRSELFGTTDFLANCGGLLGLFLGFSFLSLVEILYFGTLRLWCTLKRDSEEQKQATEQDD